MIKKITPLLFGLILSIGFVSCERECKGFMPDTCVNEDLIDPKAAVIELWDPVCGCDGNTYSNSSAAKYYGGVTSYTKGACEEGKVEPIDTTSCVDSSLINPEMPITTDWRPVCGCNGVTYSNVGSAKYHGGVTSYTEGECPGSGGIIFGVTAGE